MTYVSFEKRKQKVEATKRSSDSFWMTWVGVCQRFSLNGEGVGELYKVARATIDEERAKTKEIEAENERFKKTINYMKEKFISRNLEQK